MKEWISKYKFTLTGMIAGAIGGYLWYRFVGCSGGTCAISSNPVISTIYGSIMFGLLFHSFTPEKKEISKTENHEKENNH